MFYEIFHLIFNHTLFWTSHFIFAPTTSQDPHFYLFASFHALLPQHNCLRIKSVLTLSSSHGDMDCYPPIYYSSAFDIICNMWIGYSTFSKFPVVHFPAMTLVSTQ